MIRSVISWISCDKLEFTASNLPTSYALSLSSSNALPTSLKLSKNGFYIHSCTHLLRKGHTSPIYADSLSKFSRM